MELFHLIFCCGLFGVIQCTFNLTCDIQFFVHPSTQKAYASSPASRKVIGDRIERMIDAANEILSKTENVLNFNGRDYILQVNNKRTEYDQMDDSTELIFIDDSPLSTPPYILNQFAVQHERLDMQDFCGNFMLVAHAYRVGPNTAGLDPSSVAYGLTAGPTIPQGQSEETGGICDMTIPRSTKMIGNVGMLYFAPGLSEDIQAVVFAHEFSHMAGVPGHDLLPPCTDKQYLMTNKPVNQYALNTKTYSACSKDLLKKFLQKLIAGKLPSRKNCLRIERKKDNLK